MVNLFTPQQPQTSGASPESGSGYQAVDTKIPPKARPVFSEISVNGVTIAESAILAEAQNHPADNPGAALRAAAEALVIRELLLQKAAEEQVTGTPETTADGKTETAEDAKIRALIEISVDAPSADEAECRRFYDNNRSRFRSEPIFEASHILLAASPADEAARRQARAEAGQMIAELEAGAVRFSELARARSACPSAEHGGNLGQLSPGGTVPEFEAVLMRLPEGEVTGSPVETRYGFHIIRMDRRIEGAQLPFEAVRPRIAAWLEAASWSKAVQQFIAVLAAEATIEGIEITGADGPLVQ
ncbi:peptidylprolyl isomerase [Martelella mediterranea]|uniref:Parvulin-like PPIase n=1 Tax=Martelella mediterranea DSM 17316 TaxID=1122214 RepID=A0A1U9Z7F0_9HYPH|nr:peptidylprolyl isomerase [Martelella mediterranea]AQZ53482.1 Putative peptidyl-prolyl cis-trans isomerase Cbf2 precursor [Martelella mediterranea DSM 17316]